MSSAVTVHDVMTREFLGVNEADELGETVSLLLETGADRAVVLRGRTPVGAMGERDALSALVRWDDPASATVADVMDDAIVRVAPDASLTAAARAMSRENVGWLLAMDGEPVGVVTSHDVVVAHTMAPETDTEPPMTEEGVIDPETQYDTQGICEACGTLARDLVEVNGQLICPNCRET